VGVSGVDLAVSAFQTHNVGVLKVNSSMSVMRAVAAKANAETVVDGVA